MRTRHDAAARHGWLAPGWCAGGALLLLLAAASGATLEAPLLPMCRAPMPAPLAAFAPAPQPRGWLGGATGLLDDGGWLLRLNGAAGERARQRTPAPRLPKASLGPAVVLRLPAGFQADLQRLLPQYRSDFEEAARLSGLDWRLLAAMGYQESRWNPQARSRTGVRGLMMLTQGAAFELGVNREDARQSILGAGRLLRALYGQLPPQIREPDRTAMALAAYNQGLGHLQDARDVADLRGGNPDRWADVRQALPLLSHALWVQTTKYGSARGTEAVGFVDGVHGYYAQLETLAPAPVPDLAAER